MSAEQSRLVGRTKLTVVCFYATISVGNYGSLDLQENHPFTQDGQFSSTRIFIGKLPVCLFVCCSSNTWGAVKNSRGTWHTLPLLS